MNYSVSDLQLKSENKMKDEDAKDAFTLSSANPVPLSFPVRNARLGGQHCRLSGIYCIIK